MATTRRTMTLKQWQQALAQLTPQADPLAQRMAQAIEAAIAAAAANSKCGVDDLAWHLPGQQLAVDLPTA